MANFIPENTIKDIQNTANIVDVVSEVVMMKKAGKDFLGLCPFHAEKTPSFTVSPGKQIFYCFGCGVGGNVFHFLMKYEGISFPEAVRMLARRYGIEIQDTPLTPIQKKQISEREQLIKINFDAMNFFQHWLKNTKAGKKPLAYLHNRGLSQEIINKFNLGYAPLGWDNLLNFFLRKNISPFLLEKAGLVVSRKNTAGFYDRFRDRIIFPIMNSRSQVIGFGGRVMDDSLPKYLNSPETPVFNKSRSLYGLHAAKQKCRQLSEVYILEGYMDVLALHNHEIENAVATLGTAFGIDHIHLLKGYAQNMILVYDSDPAGIKAAERSYKYFEQAHINFHLENVNFNKEVVNTKVLKLPQGHDPDSFLSEFGAEKFLKAAKLAKGFIGFLMDQAVEKHGLSPEGKVRIIQDMKSIIASINDNIARSLYIRELADRIGVEEPFILEKIRQKIVKTQINQPNKPFLQNMPEHMNNAYGKYLKMEKKIIQMMLQFPEILPEIQKNNVMGYFEDSRLKLIGVKILSNQGRLKNHLADIIDIFDIKEQGIVAKLAIGDDMWDHEGCLKLLNQFDEFRKKQLSRDLQQKIEAARRQNDQKLILQLITQKQNLIKKGRLSTT